MSCPCDLVEQPQPIFNPPGRNALTYRVGDYLSFRRALLQSLPGEVELQPWRPSADGDLALQMMEWWAYLADVLTFYNERIANEDYLRTANLPESVQRLIRLLGYRPRPGIGAHGTVAALLSGAKAVKLPAGFQIQSKAGPGKQPQIFELGAATLVQPPDAIASIPVPDPSLMSTATSVLLQGTVSTIKADDVLVLLAKGWVGVDADLISSDRRFAITVVQTISQEKDPSGNPTTRITFKQPPKLPADAAATDYRLLRSTQSARVWQYPADQVIQHGHADLESIIRSIHVTDPVLFVIPDASPVEQLVSVTGYSEVVWYAYPPGFPPPVDPTQPPPPPPQYIPIPIPHTHIGFAPSLTGTWDSPSERATTLVRYAFQDVGTLIPTSAAVLATGQSLSAISPTAFPALNAIPVLIQDANGNGETAFCTANAGDNTFLLSGAVSSAPSLIPPLNVLFNLLSVTRGKTVPNEVLGSGDATIPFQEFVVKNAPLTYLPSPSFTSGTDYASTLHVYVNGVEWKEVPSFYGQSPAAAIFVTREDEQNRTHVQFGDGVNGARLPSGVNNIIAKYRYGSGADSPDAGSLTVILQPQPGLKSILNPVPVGGGRDPDPPAKIKTYAPQSVLTFGRAVSLDDYEAIAAQAPGVARAKAYWTWDSSQQRALVKIYVGDDANAVASAQTALTAADDPNRAVVVTQAKLQPVMLSLTLLVDARYQMADVIAAAKAALIDPDTGLFGANVIGIGQRIYQSQIHQACLVVPGVAAVHNLQFSLLLPGVFSFLLPGQFSFRPPAASRSKAAFVPLLPLPFGFLPTPFRFDPGEGGFFQLTTANLTISSEVASSAS